ncbi:MAG: YkgJ family cysteine cluster protein [Caulobacteraceae bacterium]
MSDATPLQPLQPAPNKSCGDCGLCCKLLGIEAISKEPGKWCAHFRRGSGCGIYSDRPTACAGFHCLWLTSDRLDDMWRPNKAGFVMFPEQDGRRLNVVVDESKPLAWKTEPYYSRLKAMSQRALDGYELLISIGWRRIIVFPDQEVDLGVINPEHKIISGYSTKDGQRVPFAMVLSDLPPDDA